MKRAMLAAALLVATILAGCAASDADVGGGSDTVPLQAGKGAIAGLLVDDRFRPIHLTDNPDGEFQATGFVLLQETGQEAKTNENGEFAFTNVAPGTYSLRVTAAGHEATPQTVQVQAGEFAEASIVARRTASETSTILTQEYTVFVACSLTVVMALNFNMCDGDLSGDSDRSSFKTDYTAIEGVTYLIAEMQANQEARYELDLWYVPPSLADSAEFYANAVFTGDYIRMVLEKGEKNTEHEDLFRNQEWNNTYPFQTDLLIYGLFAEEGSQLDDFFLGGGVGVHLGVQARFMHSLFLGEPEEDISTYCVLC